MLCLQLLSSAGKWEKHWQSTKAAGLNQWSHRRGFYFKAFLSHIPTGRSTGAYPRALPGIREAWTRVATSVLFAWSERTRDAGYWLLSSFPLSISSWCWLWMWLSLPSRDLLALLCLLRIYFLLFFPQSGCAGVLMNRCHQHLLCFTALLDDPIPCFIRGLCNFWVIGGPLWKQPSG